MIRTDRLAEITATCDQPGADAEVYRGMCSELLDQIAAMAAADALHLRRLIEQHGCTKKDDLLETGRATEKYLKNLTSILHSPTRRR